MPYHKIAPPPSEPDNTLVSALVQELRTPPTPANGAADSALPDITEEETPRGLKHVTVVWNGWGRLGIEERGNVILEAYRQVQGEEAAKKITIALGVTPSEAARLLP